ncbi:MAG: hypothetical protein ABW252_12695 [Polyangiales bacterium]
MRERRESVRRIYVQRPDREQRELWRPPWAFAEDDLVQTRERL